MISTLTGGISSSLAQLSSDPDYNRVFLWLANRIKDSNFTKVQRAADKTGLTYKAARSIFQHLSDLGCGQYIAGRHGSESRIKWHYSLKAIGEAALGGDVDSFDIDFENLELDDEDDAEVGISPLEHRFQLRKDFLVSIRLPDDLTAAEAERLAGFIRSLPF